MNRAIRCGLVALPFVVAAAVGAVVTWFGWVVRLIDRAERVNGTDGWAS
jgi:hypothetical protein